MRVQAVGWLSAGVLAGAGIGWAGRSWASPVPTPAPAVDPAAPRDVTLGPDGKIGSGPGDFPKDVLRHGIPSDGRGRLIFVDPGHVIEYDPRTRQALWSCEREPTGRAVSVDRQNSRFHEDERVDAGFRATLDDYRGSGYDRGHLTPAGAPASKQSQQAMDATFNLSNISPQVGVGFNRHYWARLEHFCRELRDEFDFVSVCTGPLFLAKDGELRMKVIGEESSVWVPTHFYKVVLAERGDEKHLAAFIVPNAPIPQSTPMSEFAVERRELERASGLKFFTRVADDDLSRTSHLSSRTLPPPNFWAKKEATPGVDAAPPAGEDATSESVEAVAPASVILPDGEQEATPEGVEEVAPASVILPDEEQEATRESVEEVAPASVIPKDGEQKTS
jgi:endonuclease G, mitochondrial